jgi:hypothetical protein
MRLLTMAELHLSPEYIAGLFDGEGWFNIHLYKGNRSKNMRGVHVPRAAIAMREKHILEAIQKRYGGSLNLNKARKEEHSDSWRWTLSGGQNLIDFIEEISPFLIAKYEAAMVALSLQKIKVANIKFAPTSDEEWQAREEMRKEMNRINTKGIGKEQMPITSTAFENNGRIAP